MAVKRNGFIKKPTDKSEDRKARNGKYIYKFHKSRIKADVEYIGIISRFSEKEDSNNKKICIWVRLDVEPSKEYLLCRQCDVSYGSSFHRMCLDLGLIGENGYADLKQLDTERKVCVTLNELDNGIMLVDKMSWYDPDNEDTEGEDEDFEDNVDIEDVDEEEYENE